MCTKRNTSGKYWMYSFPTHCLLLTEAWLIATDLTWIMPCPLVHFLDASPSSSFTSLAQPHRMRVGITKHVKYVWINQPYISYSFFSILLKCKLNWSFIILLFYEWPLCMVLLCKYNLQLSLFSIAVIYTMTKTNLGRKEFDSVYKLQSIMKGSQGLFSMAHSACVLT